MGSLQGRWLGYGQDADTAVWTGGGKARVWIATTLADNECWAGVPGIVGRVRPLRLRRRYLSLR